MRSTNVNLRILNLDHDKLQNSNLEKLHLRISNILDDESTTKVVDKLSEKKNCSETEAAILITGLMQSGGSNKSAGNSTRFEFERLFLTASELQSIVSSVKPKATNRQLARALTSEIIDISIALNLEGDLANQMRYEHPDLTLIEAIWCSNFQTTNPDCPEKVRNWLVQNYRSRFNK